MRRNNDKMLLESLVRKYGKSELVRAINEMNEQFLTIEQLPVFFDGDEDRDELLSYFEDNDITVTCGPTKYGETPCTFVCNSYRASLILTDFIIRYYCNDNREQVYQEIVPDYPEILKYWKFSRGKFDLYD